ncbi:hypothetical protein HMPREF1980_02167 [Actinomyces sp. oral taxon 172 str. F0311]|nr:hypothetical protein HMPREF1980_02167 [Actinomyces sp. oral taxon 172 str. F0311]
MHEAELVWEVGHGLVPVVWGGFVSRTGKPATASCLSYGTASFSGQPNPPRPRACRLEPCARGARRG